MNYDVAHELWSCCFALFGVHWVMPKRVMVCCLDGGIGLLLMIAYLFRIC